MPTRFSLARMLPALLRPAALGLLLCGGLPVTAATFCVGTGDELSQILDGPGANAANNGQDDFILLRTGRFTSEAGAIGGVNWFFQSAEGRTLSISGGWNSNCTTQSTDPTATVLEATNQRLGFILLAQDLDGSSQFSISSFCFAMRGFRFKTASRAAGVEDRIVYTSANGIQIRMHANTRHMFGDSALHTHFRGNSVTSALMLAKQVVSAEGSLVLHATPLAMAAGRISVQYQTPHHLNYGRAAGFGKK